MRLQAIASLIVACLLNAGCTKVSNDVSYETVPLPQSILQKEGAPFRLTSATPVAYPEGNAVMQRNAEFLAQYIAELTAIRPGVVATEGEMAGALNLQLVPGIQGYEIDVTEERVLLRGATEEDVFHAMQTLRKSLPAADASQVNLPAASISDDARFQYRGMHLDVSRHFFSPDFIKRYIDILALHGLNRFHWHLTDNQGWRVDIHRYPKLTAGVPHYTQDEVRDVVAYAAERFITVIPEIDLPGHMAAALKAYPELTCQGHQALDPVWGELGNVLCLGNEATYEFIEGVMQEITDIFPSQQIHIGGDEASRSRWKVCPLCQQKIKDEGLTAEGKTTAEDRLQSYCMDRVGQMLAKLGRQYIGWDEILSGNQLDGATIMIWRDPKSARLAHERGNQVIMSPGSHCYFDFYQTANTEQEPRAFGGYLPVERVYEFNPVAELSPEEAQSVIGVQANLWTEQVPTPEHAEYMLLPRLTALSEVQWRHSTERDFQEFLPRLVRMMNLYKKLGYNYSRHLFDVKCQPTRDTAKRAVSVELTNIDASPIYYTLDGTMPTRSSHRYDGPFPVTATAELWATTIRDGEDVPPTMRSFHFAKSTACPIELNERYLDPYYKYDGAVMLVDAIRGKTNFGSGDWMGFRGGPAVATIDLGQPQEISQASTSCLVDMGSWISNCSRLAVEVSTDGETYQLAGEQTWPDEQDCDAKGIRSCDLTFPARTARYVRVTVSPATSFPSNHDGYGSPAYMFIDEILLN